MWYPLQDQQKPAPSCGINPDEGGQTLSSFPPSYPRFGGHKKKSLIEEQITPAPSQAPEVSQFVAPEIPTKVSAPATQEPTVATETNLSSLKSTFSIPSSLGQTKKLGEISQQEEVNTVAEEPVTPTYDSASIISEILLTQELFEQAIISIQEVFRTANRNLELTILDQEIMLQNGEIILQVSGSIQEDIAQKMKPELVGLIRKFTGATSLTISVVQQEEQVDDRGKLYTSTDKFKFLREKHPALMDLQRKFDLDVDF